MAESHRRPANTKVVILWDDGVEEVVFQRSIRKITDPDPVSQQVDMDGNDQYKSETEEGSAEGGSGQATSSSDSETSDGSTLDEERKDDDDQSDPGTSDSEDDGNQAPTAPLGHAEPPNPAPTVRGGQQAHVVSG